LTKAPKKILPENALWNKNQHIDDDGEYLSGLLNGDDFDVRRAYVYPAAPETCNGQLDNCEELLSLGGIPDEEYDDDGDGHIECDQEAPLPLDEDGIPEWFGEFIDENNDNISDQLLAVDEAYYLLRGDYNDNVPYLQRHHRWRARAVQRMQMVTVFPIVLFKISMDTHVILRFS
jgi:hypothetical protein